MIEKDTVPVINPKEAYHETKRHTQAMFPYNVYPCTIPQDLPAVLLHWQDSMEIIYIKKGSGTAQVDLTAFDAEAGTIVFVPPGRLHSLRNHPGVRMEYENIIFDLSFLGITVLDVCSQKYLQPLQKNQVMFPMYVTPQSNGYREIAGCLDEADDFCRRKSAGYELGVKACILKLFSLLFELGEARQLSSPNSKDTDKLKTLLNYVEANYHHPLSIQEAAGVCGYSSSHFMRWFKQTAGISFTQHLNGYRLEKALEQIRDTDKTILEIAEGCGFDNLSNFNRLFKKHYGITPRESRKNSPGLHSP